MWPRRVHDDLSAADSLRRHIYADAALDEWPPDNAPSDAEPWATFASARAQAIAGRLPEAVAAWRGIADDPDVESRQRLQAWHLLRHADIEPPEREASIVFGAAAEVAVDGGHDLLIAYRDKTARYLSHAGSAAVVEGNVTAALSAALDHWFSVADALAAVVGVWDSEDLPRLPVGNTRILILTPGGKRFGQGADEVLRRDSSASAYLGAATSVLMQITDQI